MLETRRNTMKLTKTALKRLIKEELKRLTEDPMSEDMEGSYRETTDKFVDQVHNALSLIEQMRDVTLKQFVADAKAEGINPVEDIREQVMSNLNGAMNTTEDLALLVENYMEGKRK